MVATPVSEDETVDRDTHNPGIEIVEFTCAAAADYYDCKKLSNVDACFTTNVTTDSQEYQALPSVRADGGARVTISPETATDKGYLVMFGRK